MTKQPIQAAAPNPKLEDSDSQVLDLPVTIKPVIDVDDPETFFTPREMYAKSLINSPVDFLTLNISVEIPDDDDSTRTTMHHEIDMAIHPQLGALICGSVFPDDRGQKPLRSHIEDQVEALDSQRQLVTEMLTSDGRLYDGVPPIGLFVSLRHSQQSDLPEGWDYRRAVIAPEDHEAPLYVHLQAAMSQVSELAGWQERSAWQRLLAIMHDNYHVSALQWLLIYEAI